MNGQKKAPTRDMFDQPPCEGGSIRSKLADHLEDDVVLSPGVAVLVTSPGRNRQTPSSSQPWNNSMVSTFSRVWINRVNKVADLARGQLNWENYFSIVVPVRA